MGEIVIALISLVKEFFSFFYFVTIVTDYERGVILQLGRFRREIGPGWWLKCPFYIDVALTVNVVFKTVDMKTQTLTTGDGQSVVVSPVISYRIRNIQKFLLKIDDASDALKDSVYGVIGEIVRNSTYGEMTKDEWHQLVLSAIRREASTFGIQTLKVRFSDFGKLPTVRIINSKGEGESNDD